MPNRRAILQLPPFLFPEIFTAASPSIMWAMIGEYRCSAGNLLDNPDLFNAIFIWI